jgi:hypothetical protein
MEEAEAQEAGWLGCMRNEKRRRDFPITFYRI